MDPLNLTALLGLLMLGIGVAVAVSWPVALIVTGACLLVGSFVAARGRSA